MGAVFFWFKIDSELIKSGKDTLAPGEETVFTAELPAPDAGEQHENAGTATGIPDKTPGDDNSESVKDEDKAFAKSEPYADKVKIFDTVKKLFIY